LRKVLRKKAKWKGFNSKTRKLSVSLLLGAVCCLVITLACVFAVRNDLPGTEVFQSLGLFSVISWVTLTALSMISNVGGVMISRIERYQRLNPIVQKHLKGSVFGRLAVSCASSYRAGHTRAYRSRSHSNASKDSSNDGEPDSEDPPALYLFSVVPSLTLFNHFSKQNNFPYPWHCVCSPGCWRLPFAPLFAVRRWGK
jgi:hypothetical protein